MNRRIKRTIYSRGLSVRVVLSRSLSIEKVHLFKRLSIQETHPFNRPVYSIDPSIGEVELFNRLRSFPNRIKFFLTTDDSFHFCWRSAIFM